RVFLEGRVLSVPRLPRSALVGVRCCLRKPLRQHLTACLMDVIRPELTSVHTSGRTSPPPTRTYTDSHPCRFFCRGRIYPSRGCLILR
ncbi:MAG: hypothetical protein FWG87_05725, partial [Defluviitaleaceae bacterium]|nr:hypothetical protein [Defluviitaleaceae bacterium]